MGWISWPYHELSSVAWKNPQGRTDLIFPGKLFGHVCVWTIASSTGASLTEAWSTEASSTEASSMNLAERINSASDRLRLWIDHNCGSISAKDSIQLWYVVAADQLQPWNEKTVDLFNHGDTWWCRYRQCRYVKMKRLKADICNNTQQSESSRSGNKSSLNRLI